jgi:hypothetical protein
MKETEKRSQFSDKDLEVLRAAIASGMQTVSYSDRSVTYRSLDDMIRLYNLLCSSKSRSKKTIYASFSSGLRRGERWPNE